MAHAGPYSSALAKAKGIGPRVRDYLAVAESARFRVSQRRRRLDAARYSMGIVILAAVLNSAWTALTNPAALPITLVVMITLAIVAGYGYLAIAARPRRPPNGILLVVLVSIDVAAAWLSLGREQVAVVAYGNLLLLPVIVAYVSQWPARFHFPWLILHVAATLAYTLLAPQASAMQREAILLVLAVTTALSAFGHAWGLRARVLSFVQLERINALNRQVRRDKARLSQLNAILAETASTDELTGLKNRLGLKLDLATVRARIARRGERYVLLLCDLDRFKSINDQLGHVAGDDVLRKVARCLQTSFRPEDGVYRYGGEEYALLARVESTADAVAVAERIRKNVAGLRLPHAANVPYGVVTLSVGATMIDASDLQAHDDTLFGRADEALYRAKSEGRNRSEVSAGPAPGRVQPGALSDAHPSTHGAVRADLQMVPSA